MANVVFLLDFDPGHVYPTLALARSLERRGHRVSYLGVTEMAATVRDQGFDYGVILEDLYPEGELARRRRHRTLAEPVEPAKLRAHEDHLGPLLDGALDGDLETLEPDLVVVSSFLALEALVLSDRYGLPLVLFTPLLRDPRVPPAAFAARSLTSLSPVTSGRFFELALARRPDLRSLGELTEPIASAPELLACPREFELPGIDRGLQVTYIGPSVLMQRTEAVEPVDIPLEGGQELIYVSLGTQSDSYRSRALAVLRAVAELARSPAAEGWRFVISLGRCFTADELGEVPPNTTVGLWWPQTEVLQRAALMITHGGLGTVKECILARVPMVVVPLMSDQPENAERICHHGLGTRVEPGEVTADLLRAAIRETLAWTEVRSSLAGMSQIFSEQAAQPTGAERIERRLAGS